MNRLGKFVALPREEKRLLVRALFSVASIRAALWIAPAKTLRSVAGRSSQQTVERHDGDEVSIDRIVQAVERVSPYVPKATCLTQALAAQIMLTQEGYSTRLVIGVAKSDNDDREAHAWVEHQGRVIIGDLGELSRYAPLVGKGL
jgi:hypothetical protein